MINIIVGWLAGVIIYVVAIRFWKIFAETERERNARDNERLNAAYKLGYKAGRTEALIYKNTPNEIRAILGLPPIKEEKTDAEDNDTGEAAESE